MAAHFEGGELSQNPIRHFVTKLEECELPGTHNLQAKLKKKKNNLRERFQVKRTQTFKGWFCLFPRFSSNFQGNVKLLRFSSLFKDLSW